MKKVGIPGDNLLYKNPPKFPSSDSALHSIFNLPLALGISQAPPAASVAPEVHPEAPPVASAAPEASSEGPPTASVAPEAVPVAPETVLAGSEESAAVFEAGAP